MKQSLEDRLAMAVKLINVMHRRLDGLEAELTELRRKTHPQKSYVRKAPQDAVSATILAGLVAEASTRFGVDAKLIAGKARSKEACAARSWLYYEANARGVSAAGIGRWIGRDHSTILHGIRMEEARRLHSAPNVA